MPQREIPHRTYHRAAAMRAGFDPIIAELDAITLRRRRAPMPRALRGAGWRQVENQPGLRINPG
jgi:hypothetical protein